MLVKKVIVFDFDGTLIQSNRLKYEAYFQLFPNEPEYRKVIETILKTSFEESRYVILRRILLGLGTEAEDRVAGLAAEYNRLVLAGAIACPETDGAENVLRSLASRFRLYVSSTTPEDALKEIVQARSWMDYFCEVFGYPRDKEETLRAILERERITPEELLVVGDGASDRLAAHAFGCDFRQADTIVTLADILGDLLMSPEGQIPEPFASENFILLQRGIWDDPLVNVFTNEKKDFALLSPCPRMDYEHYIPRGKQLKKEDYKKKLTVIERRFGKIAPYLVDKPSILEIGAGDAGFLAYLRTRFPDAALAAMDQDLNTREARENVVGTKNNFASIEELTETKKTFSFICLFHVLEHIVNPGAFLSLIKQAMENTSILVIEVPSLFDPLLSLYKNENYQEFYFQKQHPFVYSQDSLQKLMEFSGFKTLEIIDFQRYGLENHLNWLVEGKPGGNETFQLVFRDLENSYIRAIEAYGKTDSAIWIGILK